LKSFYEKSCISLCINQSSTRRKFCKR